MCAYCSVPALLTVKLNSNVVMSVTVYHHPCHHRHHHHHRHRHCHHRRRRRHHHHHRHRHRHRHHHHQLHHNQQSIDICL